MMNNFTNEFSPTNSLFRDYLLGESIKNIFIRLTVILSAIILVWCGIMFALIIHTKCQRTKQMLKTSNTHHHLYDSNSSLNKKRSNRSKRNRRFNSSSSSLSSTSCCCCCCCSVHHILSELKQRCGFLPSSTINENSIQQTSSSLLTKPKQQIGIIPRNTYATPNKVQLVVESMTRRSIITNQNSINIGKRISLYREGDSSSGDQLRNLHIIETNPKIEIESHPNTTIQLIQPKTYVHHPSISFPITEIKYDHPTKNRLQKLHQFNTKATLFFHPITRRFSNTSTTSCLPPTNTIQKQQQSKPLLMISSARELTTNNEWKLHHTLIDEPTITDGSRTSSSRHIPLVMITDTSSSNTNIVELETFEDEHRLIGDIERRLSRELRASYRPRHST